MRVEGPGTAVETPERLRLRRAAQEFEAVLLTQMLRAMRRATESMNPKASFAGRSAWQDLLDESLALALARAGGLGLARVLEEAMRRW